MENILLTGSTGCLGSHLLEQLATLEKEIKVSLLVRNPDKFQRLLPSLDIGDLEYELIEGDLGDFELVSDLVVSMDTIFHVAAVFDFESPWKRFERINVEGTKVMVENMKPGSNFILTSSDGIYGFPNLDRGLHEDEPQNPQSLYHKSKLLQENAARELCGEKGINYTVVRPTNIVGPRDNMTAPRIIRSINNGSMMLIRGGEHKVSLVHPVDIARAHVLAYQQIDEIKGEAFHIASTNVSWKEYIHKFCEELGVDPIRRSVPYFFAYFVGFLGDIFPFSFLEAYSRFNVKFAGTNHVLDISRAENMLEYTPIKDIEDIVEESVEWYKSKYDD